nr:basic proline-rich protein-like [Aegilops tauschii subsp. strangulata]
MYSANARRGCSTTAGCRPAHPPPGPAPGFRGLRAANPELGPSASARTSTSICPGRRLRPPAPDPRRVTSGRGRVPRTGRLRVPRTGRLRVPARSPTPAAGRPAPAVSGSPPGRLLPTLTPASPPPAPAPVAAPSLYPAAGSPGRPDQPPAPPSTRPAGSACAGFCRVRAPAGSARHGRTPVPRDSALSGIPGGLPRWLARARTAGSTRHRSAPPASQLAGSPPPAQAPPASRPPACRLAAPMRAAPCKVLCRLEQNKVKKPKKIERPAVAHPLRPPAAPAHSAACREKEERGAGCPSGRLENSGRVLEKKREKSTMSG